MVQVQSFITRNQRGCSADLYDEGDCLECTKSSRKEQSRLEVGWSASGQKNTGRNGKWFERVPRYQTTTQPPQHPPWSPSPESLGYTPAPPALKLATTGRPVCCSCGHIRHDVRIQRSDKLTLLYFLISRTRLLNASSTLMRCFAEVSINLQPKCLARSRPSKKQL